MMPGTKSSRLQRKVNTPVTMLRPRMRKNMPKLSSRLPRALAARRTASRQKSMKPVFSISCTALMRRVDELTAQPRLVQPVIELQKLLLGEMRARKVGVDLRHQLIEPRDAHGEII